MKILYANFVISYQCGLNCDYCALSKEERKQKDFLDFSKFKLYFFQIMKIYKTNNYEKLVIGLTGDELHAVPNFLEYLENVLQYIKTQVEGIPKQNIKLKMHTNLQATKDFYNKQFDMIQSTKEFCTPEFETVYQSMYHTPANEEMLLYIKESVENRDVDFVSSIGLRQENERSIIEQLPADFIYDFGNMPKREKFTDDEVNFIVVLKSQGVENGCGHNMGNLLLYKDKSHCTECPNESCLMLENINRI